MHQFKELKVWQKSKELAVDVYKITRQFPQSETFALTSQVQRAVISISSNIAEGSGRHTDKEFARFLDIANGSAYEVESLLCISADLEFISSNQFNELSAQLSEIQKMLYSLKKSLKI
ncbi:four helix bundle protein [Prolixibacteraceae bacterium JC049]|nr:four helix bundle protein [Prolixibacteraceae bacterium JC049]